jgi:hypothetical protein
MKLLTSFTVPSLGSMGKSRDGDHEWDAFPMATDTRRWTSFCEGGSGVIMVPTKGALLDVISKRQRGRLRSGTTPGCGTSQ